VRGQQIEADGPAVFRLDCKMGLEAEPVTLVTVCDRPLLASHNCPN
jgi:hypothetical protein